MSRKKIMIAIAAIGSLGFIPLMSGSAEAASYILDFDSDANGNVIDVNDLGISVGDWKNDLGNDAYAVSDQWLADFGVTISTDKKDVVLFNTDPNYYWKGTAARKSNGQFKGAFDEDLLTGDDYLTYKEGYEGGSTNLGNVLIIQERNNYFKTDDEGKGGTISFDFEELVDLSSIDLLDIDEFKAKKLVKFKAFDENDNEINTWEFDQDSAVQLSENSGDNSLYRFNFDANGVKRLSVVYPGSGAIAALRWDKNQAPPTIPEPATIIGLLAVGGLGLRLKRTPAT